MNSVFVCSGLSDTLGMRLCVVPLVFSPPAPPREYCSHPRSLGCSTVLSLFGLTCESTCTRFPPPSSRSLQRSLRWRSKRFDSNIWSHHLLPSWNWLPAPLCQRDEEFSPFFFLFSVCSHRWSLSSHWGPLVASLLVISWGLRGTVLHNQTPGTETRAGPLTPPFKAPAATKPLGKTENVALRGRRLRAQPWNVFLRLCRCVLQRLWSRRCRLKGCWCWWRWWCCCWWRWTGF